MYKGSGGRGVPHPQTLSFSANLQYTDSASQCLNSRKAFVGKFGLRVFFACKLGLQPSGDF